MEIPLIFVTTSLVFLFCFSLAIFSIIVLRRIIIQRREARFEKLAQDIEKDLLRVITAKDLRITRETAERHRNRPAILVHALIHFIETFQEEERGPLKMIFDLALRDRILKRIRSRNTIRRLKAARAIILFSGPSDTDLIMRLLRDKPAVRLAAINALSRIPNPTTISHIFQAFHDDPEPNQRAYINVFFSLGRKIEPFVKEYLQYQLPALKLAMLIEIVAAIPLATLFGDVLRFTDHEDKEIRVRTARALGRLSTPMPEVIGALDRLAGDQAWEVQAQAIKSLGHMQSMGSMELISRGLFSPYWFCRLNAGFALSNLGADGIRRLKQTALQKEDPFASDMARMVLEDLVFFQA